MFRKSEREGGGGERKSYSESREGIVRKAGGEPSLCSVLEHKKGTDVTDRKKKKIEMPRLNGLMCGSEICTLFLKHKSYYIMALPQILPGSAIVLG